MSSVGKDIYYYMHLPLNIMKGSNMLPTVELDDDTKLGLYYLMEVYHLGFHHCVYGDWSWISLSLRDDEQHKYLTGDEIVDMDPDLEILSKLKRELASGIYPEGYKRNQEVVEEVKESEFGYKGKFGWLSPAGKFIVSDWGEHEGSAYDIICEEGWEDEYDDWDDTQGIHMARDFLSIIKHYVLIHNPSLDGGYIVTNDDILTKKQREFLYDYFIALGDKLRAYHYIED